MSTELKQLEKPFILANLDIETYHKSEGISSSGISLLMDCPRRYWHEYLNPEGKRESSRTNDKLKLGSAVHMLALEPEKFHEAFFVMWDDVDLRTKVGKEAMLAAENNAKGREIIRANEFREINEISKSILSHSLWNSFTDRKVEHSIFWQAGLFNAPLRARPDVYNDQLIIDIKTTESIKGFSNSIHSFGYHRQAAMQIDALKAVDGKERVFGFFVVEKKAPYLTACFTLDGISIEQGRREYLDAAALYSECLMSDVWPGYEEKFQEISLPKWAIKGEEMI